MLVLTEAEEPYIETVWVQYNDGSMLAITLAKYKLIFDEVDTSRNGTLGAAEVQHFFDKYAHIPEICSNAFE